MADPPPIVVLDASSLFPAVLCDTLLSVAEEGYYVPTWSDDVLEELARNLGVRIGREAADRRIADMQFSFPYAAVGGYHELIPEMTNHPKDRHVLAVAVLVDADIIVTENLHDFSADVLSPYKLVAQSADAFLSDLFEGSTAGILEVIERQAARYRRPPMSVPELLDRLAMHTPEFVELVRRWRAGI